MTFRRALALLAALPAALSAQAGQVGHLPEDSPYRDVSFASRFTVYGGQYVAAKDEAGVLPRSGPLVGIRWDVHVGGPGDIAFRVAHVSSSRTVIDPTKAAGDRFVEKKDISLAFADAGISFNLTGNKTWHSIMPMVHGSVGIVSDFGKTDAGGFGHGTTFALGYGVGVRYVPTHGRLSFRGDLGSYMYSLQYPTSYYVTGGDGTSVLGSDVPRAQWRNNWTLSLGLSFAVSR